MGKHTDPQTREVVESWQKTHPAGHMRQCSRETGISLYFIKKWWNADIPRKFSPKALVMEWFSAHPNGTIKQCADDLHVSIASVKLWKPSLSDQIVRTVVKTWQQFHPDGTQNECCRETGLSRYLIAPYFVPPSRKRGRGLSDDDSL